MNKEKIYRCVYNGCGKTTTVAGDRCQHGKAQVEMRLVRHVPHSRTDSFAGSDKGKSFYSYRE